MSAKPPDSSTLDILVQRAQNGEREAFSELMQLCHDDLMAFLSLRVSNRTMLEEVAQNTWITCYRTIGR